MAMKIKYMLAAAVIAVASVVMAGCGSETKLGYVDVQKVTDEAPQIKAIKADIDAKDKELAAKAQELDQKKGSMSQEDLNKAQADLQRQYQGLSMQYQSKVKNAMDKAMADISKEKDLSAIVPKDNVRSNGMNVQKQPFVVEGGIDITDEVIQKLQ